MRKAALLVLCCAFPLFAASDSSFTTPYSPLALALPQVYPAPPNVGLLAARPTFCDATGQTYYTTDTLTLYYSTVAGTSCTWAAIGGGGGGGGTVSTSGSPLATELSYFTAPTVITGDSSCTDDGAGNLTCNGYYINGPIFNIGATGDTCDSSGYPFGLAIADLTLGVSIWDAQNAACRSVVSLNAGLTPTVGDLAAFGNGGTDNSTLTDTGIPASSVPTASGTANKVAKFTGSTVIGNSSETDDATHAVLSPNGLDVNSTGDYQWAIANNASTGTTLNKMVCDDGAGKGIICAHTTSTTDSPLGSAIAGVGEAPGTTGSTGVCTLGFCTVIFDNSATALDFAQVSTSVDGDLSDVGATAPTNGQSYYFIVTGNSGAGTAAVIRQMAPSELNAASISGGNGRATQVEVNGATTKNVFNLNSTTPAASSGKVNIPFASSASGNTTSAVAQLPAQYAKVTCAPGLGDGFNAITADTYVQFTCVNLSGVTRTITGISCWTDNAGSSTLAVTNNAGTALLTGAVTCNSTKSGGGQAGTQSATTTLANNDGMTFSFVADGTSKTTTWTVTFTQ